MVTVRVHPNFVVSYYGFYLEGLGRVFGFDNIRFDREGFPEHTEHNDGFAFTVTTGAAGHRQTRRFYVSANDFARYDRVALDWCDRYGMVNHDPALLGAADTERVVAIGPSFGVRDWGGLLRTGRDVRRLIRAGGGVFWTDQRRHGPLPWLKNSRKQLLDRLPE